MNKVALVFAAALTLILAGVLSSGAGGEELLTNRGFETGDTTGWTAIEGTLTVVPQPHSGGFAAQFSLDAEGTEDIYQWVPVQESQAYEFSAWVLQNDPGVQKSYLAITWFDGAKIAGTGLDQSPWITDTSPEYRNVTTGPRVAPLGADTARVSLTLETIAAATVLADDFSFVAIPGVTLTPATPTPSATPEATPTTTASPAPTPTAAPSTTPDPPTPTASPTPIVPPPTPTEPLVFPQLVNGGFEEERADGTPYGWRKIGGELAGAAQPVRSGARSLALSSATTSTKWAYQTVFVEGGAYYEASVYAAQDNPQPGELFLRVSWYATSDGAGEALSSDDSLQTVAHNTAGFELLATGPVEAPAAAESARVRLMLRPADAGAATAFFDDAAFVQVEAPADTPHPTRSATATATASPSASPAQSASATLTPTPSVTPTAPPTPTAAPTASPTPTAAPTASPTPTAAPGEPLVFPALANGDFEEAREDGTPYGWRKVGGAVAASNSNHASGELALELSSATASTKWAYQAVIVHPGAFYEAAGWAMTGNAGDEVLLRVSWYTAEDGSGQAIGSDDSAAISGEAAAFRFLSTSAIQAPDDARSARVRLLLRPGSGAPSQAYFDAVTFGETAAPAAPPDESSGPTPRAVRPAPTPRSAAADTALTPQRSPAVLAAHFTPVVPANVRPATVDKPAVTPLDDAGVPDWVLWLAVVVPALGIAGLLGADYVRGRREEAE